MLVVPGSIQMICITCQAEPLQPPHVAGTFIPTYFQRFGEQVMPLRVVTAKYSINNMIKRGELAKEYLLKSMKSLVSESISPRVRLCLVQVKRQLSRTA